MTYKIAALALIAAALPAAPDGRVAPEQVAEPAAEPAPEPAAQQVDGQVALATEAPPPASGFNSQVAFSPTYSSGYYYASPYAGYTSLAYYGSIYTARSFGG